MSPVNPESQIPLITGITKYSCVKCHEMPDNLWLVVMVHCSESLLMTHSWMVLRRHCFSSL